MIHKKSIIPLLLGLSLLLNSNLSAKYQEADYVVVGVGTAGAVVAKKLTDDRKTSVIALHRGENLTEDPLIKYSKNAFITVPSALLGPPFFINGLTVPQPNADNRQAAWVMALPEGGASSVNAGAFVRGTNQVYARWEAIAGPLWSVSRILSCHLPSIRMIPLQNCPMAYLLIPLCCRLLGETPPSG